MRRQGIFFAGFVLALIVLTMPLRLALSWIGADRWLSAAHIEGTIWSGVLHDARAGALVLGDVDVALDAWTLLSGRAGLRFTVHGMLDGTGLLRMARNHRQLDAQALRVPLQAFAPDLPLQGQLMMPDLHIAFEDGLCREARGSAMLQGIGLRRGGLALAQDGRSRGALGCAGRYAILRLAGEVGEIAIRTTLQIAADGSWRMENRIPGLAEAGEAFAGAGFVPQTNGLVRVDQGRLAL